jgi:hypothetical protein
VYSLEYNGIPKAFSKPHHVSYCCTNVIWRHCWATMCSNNVCRLLLNRCDPRSLLRNNVFQRWHWLTLLRKNVFQQWGHLYMTMDPGHAGCLLPRKTRQTDRYARFFAHAKASRTSNKNFLFSDSDSWIMWYKMMMDNVQATSWWLCNYNYLDIRIIISFYTLYKMC